MTRIAIKLWETSEPNQAEFIRGLQQLQREVARIGSKQDLSWTTQVIEVLETLDEAQFAEFLKSIEDEAPAQNDARPSSIDVFASGTALIPSNFAFQAVIAAQQNAASGADRWQQAAGHAPFFVHQSAKSFVIVEYRVGENEIIDDRTSTDLWEQVKGHSDLDNDTVAAMLAHLIKGPLDEQYSTWFWASNMCDYRGILPRMQADTPGGAKRRAGHRQEDMQDISQCVNRAANIWLTLDQFIYEEPAAAGKRRHRKRKQYSHKGRLLSVDEVWYQRELDTGNPNPSMPIGWRIRAGSWLQTFLEKPNRQVAYMCQRILKYDPYREQWEKRLAYYMLFTMRMNAAGGGVFNREIGKLLEDRSLPIDRRNPERTKQRFEKALNRLVEDRIIDEWKYVEDVQCQARGWVDTWLANKITIYIAPPKQMLDEASK
jgi:hypothetical protein